LLALLAGADLEESCSLWIDVSGKQEFEGVVADRHTIGEFDNGKAIIKDFERSFLPFSFQAMAHDEDRLPFPLDAKVAQRALRRSGAGELAAGAGSY